MTNSSTGMNTGPANPFLADSGHAMAHIRCDQQDSTPTAGPTGPSRTVTADEMHYSWLGPCHFGGLTSGEYPDGNRVIWSNGSQQIVKLDYDTLEVLASLPVIDGELAQVADFEAALDGLDTLEGGDAVGHAVGLALTYMMGLDGVYSLLDCGNVLFLGRKESVVAYAETDPTDRNSSIIEKARWEKPDHIVGDFVGANLTFDGRLVMSTDHGWIVCLERDFSSYEAIQLPGAAEQAVAHCARMLEERGHAAYGWLRTSMCVDEDNGIYTSSVDHTHKVVWTGDRLSLDPADGAWSAEYRNGTCVGSGTTPCLMGFGDEDRFVVIGDGDDVVNITLFWRDDVPEKWTQLEGAPSRRIAGLGAANMGNPDIEAIQTEQSITVSGYGAMTVNNEPASFPEQMPERGVRMLAFYLGHKPEFTPHGLHKYQWDPEVQEFKEAWINNEVSSPNSVPVVSEPVDLVYTCGARNGKWTVEALDWSTGESKFHYVMGGSKFNTIGAGMAIDDDGRLTYGTMFGKVRVLES